MEKTKDLIRIAKELNNLYLSKKQALPYSINIIRELHATENANSRILRGLLQYSPDGQYPILHSFIELMELVADCVIDISIMAPELSNEEGSFKGKVDIYDMLVMLLGKFFDDECFSTLANALDDKRIVTGCFLPLKQSFFYFPFQHELSIMVFKVQIYIFSNE